MRKSGRNWPTEVLKTLFFVRLLKEPQKPLSNNVQEAERWAYSLPLKERNRVFAFDHYRARMNVFTFPEHFFNLMDSMGGIKKWRFYFLEDQSGADKEYLEENVLSKGKVDRNGPIENAGREDSVQDGMILDQMVYMPAVLMYFDKPENIIIDRVLAAKYSGVDYDDSKLAKIRGETFAAMEFSFIGANAEQVKGEVFIGKGVRGSSKFFNMERNVKVLEIEGLNGDIVRLDFRNHIILLEKAGSLKDRDGLYSVTERYPYYYFVRQILENESHLIDLCMQVTAAAKILNKLDEVRQKIDYQNLPTYLLSNPSNNRPETPYLEDILAQLGW